MKESGVRTTRRDTEVACESTCSLSLTHTRTHRERKPATTVRENPSRVGGVGGSVDVGPLLPARPRRRRGRRGRGRGGYSSYEVDLIAARYGGRPLANPSSAAADLDARLAGARRSMGGESQLPFIICPCVR